MDDHYCLIISQLECRWCAIPEGVRAVTQIVTLNFSVFLGILNGDYDLVIIDVHAGTELYFIVYKTLSYELKIYYDNYLV